MKEGENGHITIKSAMDALLAAEYSADEEDGGSRLHAAGLRRTGAAMVALALFEKCAAGDTNSVKLLLTEISGSGNAENGNVSAFAELSDSQLEALLDEQRDPA